MLRKNELTELAPNTPIDVKMEGFSCYLVTSQWKWSGVEMEMIMNEMNEFQFQLRVRAITQVVSILPH